MFTVRKIRPGLFRDKAWVTANTNNSQSRIRLGWDLMGAPDLKREFIIVTEGDEFTVFLPRKSVQINQQIDLEQVEKWPAFRKLWKRSK